MYLMCGPEMPKGWTLPVNPNHTLVSVEWLHLSIHSYNGTRVQL